MINEPNNGQHFGGQVAAPIFSAVMGEALRILDVPNDAPAGDAPAGVPNAGFMPEGI